MEKLRRDRCKKYHHKGVHGTWCLAGREGSEQAPAFSRHLWNARDVSVIVIGMMGRRMSKEGPQNSLRVGMLLCSSSDLSSNYCYYLDPR